jgi:hypothetical protein
MNNQDQPQDIFAKLASVLKDSGIEISAESIEKHSNQGWMSSVHSVDSNIGKLMVHNVKLLDAHVQNKVWDKFTGLASIFKSNKEIATAQIYFSGLLDGNFILVQQYLEGQTLGKRILKDGNIVDERTIPGTGIISKIALALSAVHAVTLDKFGWPVLENGQLRGTHDTWNTFLKAEIPKWIGALESADMRLGHDMSFIKELKSFAETLLESVQYDGRASLVHGDAIGPSNILVNGSGSVHLIDWEWSIAADPAWEFSCYGWEPFLQNDVFDAYFKSKNFSEQQSSDFMNRVKIYTPLWLLWGAHIHAPSTDPVVYNILRSLLEDKMTASK